MCISDVKALVRLIPYVLQLLPRCETNCIHLHLWILYALLEHCLSDRAILIPSKGRCVIHIMCITGSGCKPFHCLGLYISLSLVITKKYNITKYY